MDNFFSLFSDEGEFLLEADVPCIAVAPLIAAAQSAGLFDEFVGDGPVAVEEPAVVETVVPKPVLPRYSESEIVAARLAGQTNVVLVQKVGNKGISVTGMDLDSALMLLKFKIGSVFSVRPDLFVRYRETGSVSGADLPVLGPNGSEPEVVHESSGQTAKEKRTFDKVRIYFDIKDCIAASFRESKAYKFIESLGVSVVVSPSFENWVPREHRRQVRDNTPLLLPEVVDERSLYDRLDDGTIIRCTHACTSVAVPPQEQGHRISQYEEYVVGQKVEPDAFGEGGHVLLHLRRRGATHVPVRWNAADPMEPFFEPEFAAAVIYDPAKCIPEVYKEEFDVNKAAVEAKIESGEWCLFDHTVYDVSQAAILPNYFNGKQMRMGKTRESIVWHRLRGHKYVAFFCPKNVAGFIARELDALNIKDYKIINDLKDLDGPQPWMEIISYGWMKHRFDPTKGKAAVPVLPERKACPHCGVNLSRRYYSCPDPTVDVPHPIAAWIWTSSYGYLCRNQECQYVESVLDPKLKGPAGTERRKERIRRGLPESKRAGAAWFEEAEEAEYKHDHVTHGSKDGNTLLRRGSGYVDLDRKAHVLHMFDATGKQSKTAAFHGRECLHCHYVERAWQPPRYRRLNKCYDGITFDEIHNCATGNSQVTKAVLSLHCKEVNGLTGTLMPNDPSDAYWPLMRMFGNNTHRFPYSKTRSRPYGGVAKFNKAFISTLTITNYDKNTSYQKRVPYIKNPVNFWNFMSPKMIRRTYDDPLVISSFAKAGFHIPTYETKMITVPPGVKQAALMMATMQDFDVQFQEYRESLAAKGTEDKTYLLNSAYIISRMTRMRMGATCPDYINRKLAELNMPAIYDGPRGGAKMEQVYNVCLNKCSKGEKVLVLSGFKDMQRSLFEELKEFRPILFDTSWDGNKRQEAFDLFNEDPDYQVFIGGTLAVGEGTDLAGGPDSKCRTVISTDLDWRPGKQFQAWSRILKPSREEYLAEIYIFLLDASIDQHVYNTFYSKLVASEQALDRKVITKVQGVDIGTFVELVLADRDRMLRYLQDGGEDESAYMPYIEMFASMAEDREL